MKLGNHRLDWPWVWRNSSGLWADYWKDQDVQASCWREHGLWGTASGKVINLDQEPETSGCICLCLWVRQLGGQEIKDTETGQTECLRPVAEEIHIFYIYIYVCKYIYFLLRSFHPYKGTRSSHLYSFCLCECCCSMFLYLSGQLCESMCALCVCLFRVHSDTSLLAVPQVPELIHQIQQFVISTFGETWETDNENCKNCEEMSFLSKKRSKGKKSVL